MLSILLAALMGPGYFRNTSRGGLKLTLWATFHRAPLGTVATMTS